MRLGASTPEAGLSTYYLDRFTKNFMKMKNKLKGRASKFDYVDPPLETKMSQLSCVFKMKRFSSNELNKLD